MPEVSHRWRSPYAFTDRFKEAGTRGRTLAAAGAAGFVAGLTAARRAARETTVHAAPRTGAWVQLNLTPERDSHGRALCYAELAALADTFLAEKRARNFFFMHKAPGIRARFQAAEPGEAAELCAALLRRTDRWEGLRRRPVCAVYEPEHYLFGGPASMAYVHDLFTLDSLAWLDHHVNHPEGAGPSVGWRQSLLMLREVFDGLGIVGWEHRGVWDAVARETGRRLRDAAAAIDPSARERAAAGVVAYWRTPRDEALRAFPEDRRDPLARHAKAAHRAAVRWRDGHFEAGGASHGAAGEGYAAGEATVGPRTAAAYLTVFHWNRGLLSLARQSLLTEALLHEGRVAHATSAAAH
ncbi:thiopeptide-type bacteriocin biosynthesis protein [Streptomyces diacarni]|uniref:thiopeptide-type bacteriocin biosynthesis protein n=1 Tax=Streptomyces diacarni TaxID=2800381 RepID=UPI0033DC839A